MKLIINKNIELLKLTVLPSSKLKLSIKPQDILVLKINTCGGGGGGIVINGIPAGGSAGQVLAKASDADYDTEWVNQQGGGGLVLNVIAGEIINGDSLVMVKDNLAYKNDPSDEGNAYFCVGFAINAAVEGQNVAITQIGEQESAGWGLLANTVYYAAANGGITTTPPVSGISQAVGIPKDSNTMVVSINEPVLM